MKKFNARFLLLGAALACAPCLLADAKAADLDLDEPDTDFDFSGDPRVSGACNPGDEL